MLTPSYLLKQKIGIISLSTAFFIVRGEGAETHLPPGELPTLPGYMKIGI